MATGISRVRKVFLLAIIICLYSFPAQAKYSGGAGELNNPYQIATLDDLILFGDSPEDCNKHFELVADVDMADVPYTTAVLAWESDDDDFGAHQFVFTGTFDGAGHHIANLTIDTGSAEKGNDYLGLFDVVGVDAVIKNLDIVNVSITGGTNSDFVGGLAGAVYNARIENCSVTGSISCQFNSDYIGGLVGLCQNSTFINNRITCAITADDGSNYIGSMVGYLMVSSVTDCSSSGSVQAGTQTSSIGGLIGESAESVVTGCFSDSFVSGDAGSQSVGGLMGRGHTISFEDCSSAGSVRGGLISHALGGLAGRLDLGTIRHCYSEAAVEGDTESYDIGGLVGRCRETDVISCCSKGPVSGGINSDYMGGLIGLYVTVGALITEGSHGIFDCNSSSSVTGRENSDHVGGLVGRLTEGGIIYNCYATGQVLGEEETGGLVGWNDGDIANCYATGDIASVYDADRLGGLVGRNEGLIMDSYATGSITGEYNSDHLGGLVGRNSNYIIACYATGSVSGGEDAEDLGGLVGYNSSSESNIVFCYSTGRISSLSDSETIGGFVGYQRNGYISCCYWDTETSEMTTGVGVIGDRSDGCTLTGLTTEQMGDVDLFRDCGWTFVGDGADSVEHNWIMVEGVGRPELRWQYESEIDLPAFSGGSGTQTDPYLIANPDDLHNMTYSPRLLDKHFKLVADIDMGLAYSLPAIGTRARPFTGVFDGDNHRIHDMTVSVLTDLDHYRGMFGCIGEDAQIKNLDLLVRMVDQECITLGGLVGYVDRGTITNCHVSGTIVGKGYVGGLVGFNYRGIIENCSSAMDVAGDDVIGGLVGFNGGTQAGCYSIGPVDGDMQVGGLTGCNEGTISDCYCTGAVIADQWAGGLVGYNDYGTITTSYSTGLVGVEIIAGGLVGLRIGGVTTQSFWDTETSGQTRSDGGIGKTTAEMQTTGTFLEMGWDFVNETENGTEDIWWIDEGRDYPHLWWETYD